MFLGHWQPNGSVAESNESAERETERQRDRETERQRGREAERQRERELSKRRSIVVESSKEQCTDWAM